MKTSKQTPAALHITARADGWFVVFDRDQKLRYKAATREDAQNWLAVELNRQHPRRQAALSGGTNSL